MTKREACHRLAEINEKISELEDSLRDIESRLLWDDESKRDWYMPRKEKVLNDLNRYKKEHDEFIERYSDIIYS